jgi:hypothetical protein
MPGADGLRLPVVRRSLREFLSLMGDAGFKCDTEDLFATPEVLNLKPGLKEVRDIPIALLFVAVKADSLASEPRRSRSDQLDPQRLDNLLSEWQRRQEQGQPVLPEELCVDQPDLLDSLRRRIEAVASNEPQFDRAGEKTTTLETLSRTPPPNATVAHGQSQGLNHVAIGPGVEAAPGYVLSRRLGQGGFGEVWQAVGPGNVPVALKLLRLDERLAAVETRALEFMKLVRHPHLLSTFGIWHKGNLLVIGMELADCSLMDRLRETNESGQPGIEFVQLVEYLYEAGKGIDYLNEPRRRPGGNDMVRIVHRDIKPHNLLIVGGAVKVGDFGLARIVDRSAVAASSGALTPVYAAPELFEGRITQFTDQYSLAVSYCQLRGGRLPFDGSFHEVMAGHLARNPDLSMIPKRERDVVARALAKPPDDRWPNCRSFVTALTEVGRG